jgi:hypothetical protein
MFLIGCSSPATKERAMLPDAGEKKEKAERTYNSSLHKLPERVYPSPITVIPSVVPAGSRIFLKMTYTVLAPDRDKTLPITQIVTVLGSGVSTELLRRRIEKHPGTHVSYLRITLPKDGVPGQYTIVSRFIAGEKETSAKGTFRVVDHQSTRSSYRGEGPAKN